MKTSPPLLLLTTATLIPSILAQSPQFHPFTPAVPTQTAAHNLTATTHHPTLITPTTTQIPQSYNLNFELLKRQNNYCAAGYTNCAYLAASNVCCSTNALCTNDANGRVACCPQGAVCTGTVSGGGATATGAVILTTTGTTSVSAGSSSSQTGFVQGSTGAVTTNTAGIVIVSGNGNSGGQVSSGGERRRYINIMGEVLGGLAMIGGLAGLV